jgi:probable HAF family extracellular repeat protein
MTRLFVVASTLILISSARMTLAQPQPGINARPQVVSYRLIDLGTLGGPNSAETVEFPYINNRGMVVGFADTSIPDPSNPEGYFFHAFRWKRGLLTDLGTLPGGAGSFAIWSNDRGQVVGISDDGHIDPVLGFPEDFATLWERDGTAINLGTLGGTQSLAAAVNDRGQIIGVAADSIPDPYSLFGWATETHGFIWQNRVMQDLGTLGGADSSASFINERGQVTGNSYVSSTPPPDPNLCGFPIITHPFFWQDGKMTDIGTLGGTCAEATTINNRGQVIGNSNLPGDFVLHPFLWERGKLQDLGTFGGTFGVANWLNNAGEITGVASTVDDQEFHAFFWRNGLMTDIGTVAGDVCSIAHFMNSRGQVVGTSGCTQEGFDGFMWEPGGSIIDLNDFVPPDLDLRVTDGETINDRGEIAGSGLLPNGDFHAVVLIPCDWAHGGVKAGCLPARQNGDAAAEQFVGGPRSLTTPSELRETLRRHSERRGVAASVKQH